MQFLKRIRKYRDREQEPSALILVYHRVRDTDTDPWDGCVGEKNFREHLEVLQRYFEVLPATALMAARKTLKKGGRQVCLTFDDGYLDNYAFAAPLLQEYQLTATFFIPTQPLSGKKAFWWETLEKICLGGCHLPEILHLNLYDEIHTWKADPLSRQNLYNELARLFTRSPPLQQEEMMRQLVSQAGAFRQGNEGYEKMDGAQIRELSDAGFGIGGHTVHHPALGYLPKEEQREEIVSGRRQLEQVIQKPVTLFAYPHGHYNGFTPDILKENGFTGACTTEEGPVKENSDPFTLPRIWIKNSTGVQFKRELDKWLEAT